VEPIAAARTRARDPRRWEEVLARFGITAKGVSYGLVGLVAIGVALGEGGATTSRQGALHRLAGNGFGRVVLALLVVGFAAYALWRIVQAFRADDDSALKAWGKRAAGFGRAAIYLGLAFSAAKIVAGSGGGSSGTSTKKATATVLSWPAGTWLVGAAGLVVIGVGVWNLYRGVTRKFEHKWRQRTGAAERWGGRAGVAGHAARGVVFGLIGIFAIKAAVEYSPEESIGLDGALDKLAQQTYGTALLALTAAGLVAYALYCIVDARYRDVDR
jgi:hypothetical protein